MKTNNLVVGILAHVDAGKTTLSESLLYLSGSIRTLGRVDHKDAFLDTYELEKARGITIFSKQAVLEIEDQAITLLDTPGHVDFSSEMERTLQVLDYAILVINGADGIQGHTLTLWKLLKLHQIPTFIFVNKMDQMGTQREKLMSELIQRLDEHCIDFGLDVPKEVISDHLAMCDEKLMTQYLDKGKIELSDISDGISQRKIFPVYFGSALKLIGVEAFIQGISTYCKVKTYPKEFGAKVYKIGRDPQGNRLTYMKITGGSLKVKEVVTNERLKASSREVNESWSEKVDQIRIYSGVQFQSLQEVSPGTICAVTGLSKTRSGEGLGIEATSTLPVLQPVLTYEIKLPEGCDVHGMLQNLRQLEEEEPHLNISWNEKLGEIHTQVMGEIEIEILKSLIIDRFDVEVEFGVGNLVYKETISEAVEGVGHFEPLRHYAEVHLLMEAGEQGSGLVFETDCSEDVFDRNWQRLVLTHLVEKKHKGVLTGSEITDMKITLVAGRGHLKHTEGGDFRQATYRAIRQGLMKAKSILLEPVYSFSVEVPKESIGRAMSDIQRMRGNFSEPQMDSDFAVIKGEAPVATMRDYHMEVMTYTKGMGKLSVELKGYEPCHNSDEIIEAIGYDTEADIENPTNSVFCAHGVGFTVPWNQVEEYMHVESGLIFGASQEKNEPQEVKNSRLGSGSSPLQDKELEEIFMKTYGPSKRENYSAQRGSFESPRRSDTEQKNQNQLKAHQETLTKREVKEKYLLVDAYNIIFAWDHLKALAKDNLDAARMQLLDLMCNYQSFKDVTVIVVFDAYKVIGNIGEMAQYHNIYTVYTKEAETADQYIERLVHNISHKYDVTVATSDALEQIIIMGKGAQRLSALGLKEEVEAVSHEIRSNYLNKEERIIHRPFQDLKDQ